MGWGEQHAPLSGSGTTGEMALAQEALAAVGIEKPNLSLAAIEAAGLIDRLRELVVDLADPEPCSFDHHGYCQAHFWMTAERPCPHGRARATL